VVEGFAEAESKVIIFPGFFSAKLLSLSVFM
jgi:hypothetical protein